MSLKSVTATGLVAFALVACSSSSDAPANEESDLRNGGVCATLDYGHTVSNAEYYRQFASDEAAADYMRKILAGGALAAHSGADASLREISRDERLVRLVDEVYGAFRKIYPSETKGLEHAPRIAIVQSSVSNAFALGPGFAEDEKARTDQSPWLFIVHTALLEANLDDNQLRALFAHELGHLILRTLLPEIQAKLRASYRVRGSEDGVLGASADDDPAVAAHVETILEIQKRVGGLPELGIATAQAGGASGQYSKIYPLLIKQIPEGSRAPSCKTFDTKAIALQNLQASLLPGQPMGLLIPTPPTKEQQTEIDRLSREIADDLRSCLADLVLPDATSLFDLTAEVNKIPAEAAKNPSSKEHADVLAKMLDEEKEADAADPKAPLIDRMLRAEVALRARELALRNDPRFPIDELRTFDYEEDADDASVRILASLGDDPSGIGRMLLASVPPALAEACKKQVDGGGAVRYGRFVDPHPATCWRYYHAKQFSNALAKCPKKANSALKVQPKGTGLPSVMTQTPRFEIERGYGPLSSFVDRR